MSALKTINECIRDGRYTEAYDECLRENYSHTGLFLMSIQDTFSNHMEHYIKLQEMFKRVTKDEDAVLPESSLKDIVEEAQNNPNPSSPHPPVKETSETETDVSTLD